MQKTDCALYWEGEEFASRCSIAQLASDLNNLKLTKNIFHRENMI
jgi:hypothetical protein